jgi:hypothetical protein
MENPLVLVIILNRPEMLLARLAAAVAASEAHVTVLAALIAARLANELALVDQIGLAASAQPREIVGAV